MTPVADCACSNLFCSEEGLEAAFDDAVDSFSDEPRVCSSPPVLEYGDFLEVDESIFALVEKEVQHMPYSGYCKILHEKATIAEARDEAVDWILKVHTHYSFAPLTAALSVNFLDRFLSRHAFQSASWMLQLASVACLSLAAKMEESEVPLLLDLQVQGAKFIFEPRTIQRMELVVLGTLEWRLSAVTPFSYVGFFLQLLAVQESLKQEVFVRINDLLLYILKDVRLLAYRPSVIAASVTLQALVELFPDNSLELKKKFISGVPNFKDSGATCSRLIQESSLSDRSAGSKRKAFWGSSVPRSPSGVLDASFGCDSESTARSLECSPNAENLVSSPAVKKQRRGDNRSDIQSPS